MSLLAQQSVDQIVQLIGEGKTSKGVQLLIDALKALNDPRYEDAILLKNRYQTLEQKMAIGVISQAEENLERAKINKGILDLAKQSAQQKAKLPAKKKVNIILPIGLILLLLAIVLYFIFDKKGPAPLPKVTRMHGQCTLDNEPLEGAILEINYGQGTLFDTTNAQGLYEVDVPQSEGHSIRLSIRKDGRSIHKRQFILSKHRLDIDL